MSNHSPQSGFTLLETIFVVAMICVIGAIAVPQLTNSIAYFRISGDARSVSNAIALTKMRAASNFAKTRLYVSLSGRWHRIEKADSSTPPNWTPDGGTTYLSTNTQFGYGSVGAPPPNTQGTIAEALPCKDNTGADIANTACVIFNSRGVPIDSSGASTSLHAVYLTDSTSSVYGVTVAATGMVRMWQTRLLATPQWTLQ